MIINNVAQTRFSGLNENSRDIVPEIEFWVFFSNLHVEHNKTLEKVALVPNVSAHLKFILTDMLFNAQNDTLEKTNGCFVSNVTDTIRVYIFMVMSTDYGCSLPA